MSPADKLLAEWFWIDRWMGSSAFLLPLAARGLYREMLSQAWRRGAQLPNNHEAIRRAVGATKREWVQSWPLIQRYWRVEADSLVNDTQVEIYTATLALTAVRSKAGKAGNKKRWGDSTVIANSVASPVASPVANTSPLSPSLSPERTHTDRARALSGSGAMAGSLPRDHVRHVWCGRKCVPDFLHGEFRNAFGGDPEQAELALLAWYGEVDGSLPEGPIGEEPTKFWRARFAVKWPTTKPDSELSMAGIRAEIERQDARVRR